MAQTGGYIEVTIRFFEEEGQWTAQCVELGTATCADSLEEAEEAIVEMVLLHLNALEDIGTCHEFLKQHGVRFHKGSADRKSRRKDVRLRVGEFGSRKRIPFPKPQTRRERQAMVM